MTTANQNIHPNDVPPEERGEAWGKGGFGWAMFEFARNPYYLLIVIFIFAPYLASDVVAAQALADGVFNHLPPEEAETAAQAMGQAYVAGVTKWGGVAAALTAPILGAALDRGPKRKPLVACFLIVLAIMSFSLWWVRPGEEGISLFWTGAILVVASVCYTYSEVTHNAMLANAGKPDVLPKISGNGLALGNGASALLMIAIVVCFALPAMLAVPFERPIFGINVEAFEHYRIAGPIAAIWLLVFIWPFFLFTPDAGKKGASWIKAAKEGFVGIIGTIKKATQYREVFKFLLARMIYADGMQALMALSAVYVAGMLGWGLVELAAYALWLTIFAALGGLLGGFLDKVLGTKHALIIELSSLITLLVLLLSHTQESLFFGLIAAERVLDGDIYSHSYDWAFLLTGGFIGLFATACVSSSRSMLVGMAPKDMVGEFFGLYAIAGTVTVWVGPLLVQVFTSLYNSQRIGMASISALFVFGLLLLLTVKYEKSAN